MIVRLRPDQSPLIDEVADLGRLHVVASHGVPLSAIGALGRVDGDGQHIWLTIDELRRRAEPGPVDPTWSGRFDAMVAYAASKGWVNDDGSAVRVHVEHLP